MRYGRIAALGVPLAVQTAIMLFGQVVVVALIGRMGGGALYVQALYAPVEFLLVALVSGLAVTLQVLTARRVGAGDRAAVAGYWGGLLKAGLPAYAVLAAVLIASAGALGGLVDVEAGHAERFRSFLAAMVLVGPLRLGGELCSAVLRGVGRGVAATSLTTAYVVLNVTLVAVLGVAGGGGLAVVPVAAAVAGAAELAAGLVVLTRAGLLTWAGVRRSAAVLGPVVGTGLPVAASYVLLFVVNLLLVRIAATGGPAAVAGFNAGYTAQTAVLVPAIGFGSAVAVLVNQAVGAGDREGAATVFRRGLVLVAGGYAVITAALLVFGSSLAGLLADDPAVVEQARGFLTVVGPTFGCTGLVLAVLTVVQQVGRGGPAVAMNLGYFAVLVGVGWAAVAATGDVSALHTTMAAVAAASLVVGAPAAVWLVRRTIATRPVGGAA